MDGKLHLGVDLEVFHGFDLDVHFQTLVHGPSGLVHYPEIQGIEGTAEFYALHFGVQDIGMDGFIPMYMSRTAINLNMRSEAHGKAQASNRCRPGLVFGFKSIGMSIY